MPITVLGKNFNTDEERREYFRAELRQRLPELKKMEGFPIGEDEDIIALSDPPYYTACPNPWLNDFITEWEEEKKELERQGKRQADFEVQEPYASDVSEGKNNPIYNAHSYHTKVPHPAIMRYILHYTQPGDIVYDGFAGTGMTGVAGAKCESPSPELKFKIETEFKKQKRVQPNWGWRNVICGDLSVVATLISKVYTSNFSVKQFEKEVHAIFEQFDKELSWMYETNHTNGEKGGVNYVVWSEIKQCPECLAEFLFTEEFYDSDSKSVKKEIKCPSCEKSITKNEAILSFETVMDRATNEVITRPKRDIFKINYNYKGKTFEKKPDQEDYRIVEKINNLEFPQYAPSFELPDMQMKRVGRVATTKVSHIHHFYLYRALHSLSFFWGKSKLIENESVRTAYLFMIEQMVWGLSLLNRFRPKGFSQVNQYMSGVFYIASHSSEINPMYLLNGKFKRLIKVFKTSLNKIKPQVNHIADCAQVDISSNSIDYIFTDPPFGENIYYSDLNILIEAWHKVCTNPSNEAIVDRVRGKSELNYQNMMQLCFSKCYKILKPGKWMTVEFSNTSASIWNSIQTSLQNSGFILANVASLDKKQGTFQAVTSPTAVKQDLIISCYKPSSQFDQKFRQNQYNDVGVWDFVEEHLHHLPVHLLKDNSTTAIIERSPKILFDRLVAFYVQRSLPVPIDAGKFQIGLKERFVERNGMYFTAEQAAEYDRKKAQAPNFVQASLFVSSEQDGVLFLKNLLEQLPLTYSGIHPHWMQALAGQRKGDIIPELMDILQENFLKDAQGRWYAPDPENETDLEALRTRRLLKQFAQYAETARQPKGKLKEARVEALRAGFKQCYKEKDFKTIVEVVDCLERSRRGNLVMEDEVLLQFFDIAATRV